MSFLSLSVPAQCDLALYIFYKTLQLLWLVRGANQLLAESRDCWRAAEERHIKGFLKCLHEGCLKLDLPSSDFYSFYIINIWDHVRQFLQQARVAEKQFRTCTKGHNPSNWNCKVKLIQMPACLGLCMYMKNAQSSTSECTRMSVQHRENCEFNENKGTQAPSSSLSSFAVLAQDNKRCKTNKAMNFI